GMIKVEVGALPAAEIGQVVVKLKTSGYQVGFQAEDIWAFV
ncbi:FkbM family methyltransferase, partial [Mesorhizobium sp. M7A.F.Ca.CA.003.01.2.1]